MRVQFIVKGESKISGMSRYAQGLEQALRAEGLQVIHTQSSLPPPLRSFQRALKRVGPDLEAFLCSYPLHVGLQEADVYHLASQTLATVLCLQRFPRPVLVTVLDVIPFLVRRDPKLNTFAHPFDSLMYRCAMRGLQRADALVTISHYSKQTLVEALGLRSESIYVIYPGIDHATFHPHVRTKSVRAKYGLPQELRYVLYVGSEDPRKNVPSLIEALALLRERRPDVRLVKVGASRFIEERHQLLRLIDAHELGQHIQFLDDVTDEELAALYNVADVFVLPSLYEGFGLPVLESMACGTPVVVSDAGAPQEIVNGAGMLCDVRDVGALRDAILAVLDSDRLRMQLRLAGLERAAQFSWKRSSQEMVEAYMLACELRRRG